MEIATTDGKVKFVFGLSSASLLLALLFKLKDAPGGIILSGLFSGGMLIAVIIIVCLILSGIARLAFKKTSFLTNLFITTSVSFLAFHYKLYSPTLTVKVQNGYVGEVNLVLSNTDDNILTVDKNGIGYLTKWTFDKTYTRPIVIQVDGKSLDKNLVGFNTNTFFGKGKFCCLDGAEIESLDFEIVPDTKAGEKQYYLKDLTALVNRALVMRSKVDKYTIIQTSTDTTTKQ